MAWVPRNRPFNSRKIEDNEGASLVPTSIRLARLAFFLSRSRSLFHPLGSPSRPRTCLSVEPKPAPRSRVQEAIVTPKRHQSPRRRFNSATRERAGPCTPRTTFLPVRFFPALLFTFRCTRVKRGSERRDQREIAKDRTIVASKLPSTIFVTVSLFFLLAFFDFAVYYVYICFY